jgi:hypothetical protein
LLEDFLARLDELRRGAGTQEEPGLVVEPMGDGGRRVVYAYVADDRLDEAIQRVRRDADSGAHEVEWKVYGHDVPGDLATRLLAAGFEAEPRESVLVLPLDDKVRDRFPAGGVDIRRVVDEKGFADVADISCEIGRSDAEQEKQYLMRLARTAPEQMSVYVAYVDGDRAACGRVHFAPPNPIAELAGGRTKTTYRRRGLFMAVVAARVAEALDRGCTYVCVDALPTSEPILRRQGFVAATWTQPFVYRGYSTHEGSS